MAEAFFSKLFSRYQLPAVNRWNTQLMSCSDVL